MSGNRGSSVETLRAGKSGQRETPVLRHDVTLGEHRAKQDMSLWHSTVPCRNRLTCSLKVSSGTGKWYSHSGGGLVLSSLVDLSKGNTAARHRLVPCQYIHKLDETKQSFITPKAKFLPSSGKAPDLRISCF